MTTEQQSTIDFFAGIARENGSKLDWGYFDDGSLIMEETASSDWDNERTQWVVGADGKAQIL